MIIKEILSQNRRDFNAIYECEHCQATEKGYGYDDNYFHESVIPKKKCPKCGLTASETYRPLATKYPDGFQV